jgi:hypothetical protein
MICILSVIITIYTASLCQGNPDRNHKLWNILSTKLTDNCIALNFAEHNGMFHLSQALPGPFPIHELSPGL